MLTTCPACGGAQEDQHATAFGKLVRCIACGKTEEHVSRRSPESEDFTAMRTDQESAEKFKSDKQKYRTAYVPDPSRAPK